MMVMVIVVGSGSGSRGFTMCISEAVYSSGDEADAESGEG